MENILEPSDVADCPAAMDLLEEPISRQNTISF